MAIAQIDPWKHATETISKQTDSKNNIAQSPLNNSPRVISRNRLRQFRAIPQKIVSWEFPNLVVSNLVVCNFYTLLPLFALFCALWRSFAPFGVLLRSFADLRLHSFALFLEKVQGATRLGATGLRASERKSASERVSERTSENLSKISENLSKNSENL